MIVNFSTPNEYQAAGPDVVDPVIIQKGKVSYRKIAHFISLHKESILRPSIIILLKDNDFGRAKKELRYREVNAQTNLFLNAECVLQ